MLMTYSTPCKIKSFMKSKRNINYDYATDIGNPLCIEITKQSRIEVITTLIKAGCSMYDSYPIYVSDVRGYLGKSNEKPIHLNALAIAVILGRIDIIDHFVQTGVDFNTSPTETLFPLHVAIKF